ncbi:tRNA/rRNA methyltransferase TrmH family [Clostridium sp. CAG:609]|jgi:RNA methyltransferase, trmH family, group 3|nr:tRNA/rRNA methyltransferase TrmH family [Clostridium sp. CAG:609]
MRVYGMNVLKELDKKKIKKVFTSRKEVCKYCSENKIKYELVDNHLLNKMCVYNHQGVVIDAFDYDYYTMKDIEGNLVLILDHLEDPHNFGAIIRTCASVGIKSIIIPKDRSVGVTDVVVKTSVGTINYVKIIMVNNLVATIKTLQKEGFFVYAASMEGTDFRKVDYSNKVALVIGNEGSGVSRLVKESSDCLISIPMNKNVESLNASVAASILIYHLGMHE